MKKVLCVILSLATVIAFMAIPSMAEDERPTLTILVSQQATVEDFETNAATLYVEEKIGANLEFILAPSGTINEKMNILLNSGEYPDIFYISLPDENLYGVESGILMDLTPLIPEMEYFNYALNYYPEMYESMYASDGKLYAFPTYGGVGYHGQYAVKCFINSANLEKLDMEAPTTTDELYEVLKAWKELDPEKNIGLIGCAEFDRSNPVFFLTNAFTYQPMTDSGFRLGLRLHEDTIETLYDDEEYREALRYIHMLYDEGLLYEGSFTMGREQATALMASEGEPVMCWTTTHNERLVSAKNSPELYAHTDHLTPLIGPEGKQYVSFQPQNVNAIISISSTCKYPEIAAQFADLFYNSDAYSSLTYGPIELGNWRHPTEEEIKLCEDFGVKPVTCIQVGAFESGVQNYKWQPLLPYVCPMADADTPWAKELPEDYSKYDFDDPVNGQRYRIYATKTQYEPYYQDEYRTLPTLKFLATENEERATMEVSLENYIAQARMDFITGAKSLDTDWEAYVAGIQNLNMDRLIEIYQTAYDR